MVIWKEYTHVRACVTKSAYWFRGLGITFIVIFYTCVPRISPHKGLWSFILKRLDTPLVISCCYLHTRRSSTQSGIYHILHWYSWFSRWWAHGCPKHVQNRNKYSWKRTLRQVRYLKRILRDARSTKHKKHKVYVYVLQTLLQGAWQTLAGRWFDTHVWKHCDISSCSYWSLKTNYFRGCLLCAENEISRYEW